MTIKQVIKILDNHNKWRRGADVPMGNTVQLGLAIDRILDYLKEAQK